MRCRYHCTFSTTFRSCTLTGFVSAYELYSDPNSDKPKVAQVGSQEKMSMAARFKSAFSHKDVKVHFVGAWYVHIDLLNTFMLITSGILFRPLGLHVESACSPGRSKECNMSASSVTHWHLTKGGLSSYRNTLMEG